MTPQQYGPLIGIGIALVVILLRNQKPRPLRVQSMWIVPLLVALGIGFGLWGMSMAPGASHAPFGIDAWAILAGGLILGAAAGYQRGRMTTIERAPDGTLLAQASRLGIILILALIATRSMLRPWLETHASDWHLNALAIQDAFLVFAAAMVIVQRVEMFIRARRIQAGRPDDHVEAAPAV
ncbi:CcdC protein domain-containing protein [Brevundimonas subvibrioides]|uniref:CcdC protein domain-containing protein n=1 Tax=Brevundimonas subvibrioides TaxID=74313 RepID=UPI0022B521AD|nr:CcdC protein domain-containing protein [Brevundimonas subvibrioides]